MIEKNKQLKTKEIIDDIEAFLEQTISQLQPIDEEYNGPGRPRILPAMCLWAGVLVCVLRGFTSQLAVWRLLSLEQLWFYPRFEVTDQAVYNRLARDGTVVLEKLFEQISAVLRERLAPYEQKTLAPFATGVVAIDETTLDPVARLLPALRDLPAGDRQLLPGKLAGVYDVRLQQWRQVLHIVNPNQNEKVIARTLLSGVEPGTLVLADMGYFGFQWFDDLTNEGCWWISRLRARTSYEVIHAHYQQGDTFDGIVWLGAYRADRAAHAVRLVTFRRGKQLHRYITNVMDYATVSMEEVAGLYARRWDFELAAKTIKRHLKLHLLWSSKTTVILQQVWAVLIIAQVLQALQMEIAGKAAVDPYDVSLALLVEYVPRWGNSGKDPVKLIVEHGRRTGFIRPSSRIRIRTPDINPEDMVALPDGAILVRKPRYAQRKCHQR
jgi:hypothetical protein